MSLRTEEKCRIIINKWEPFILTTVNLWAKILGATPTIFYLFRVVNIHFSFAARFVRNIKQFLAIRRNSRMLIVKLVVTKFQSMNILPPVSRCGCTTIQLHIQGVFFAKRTTVPGKVNLGEVFCKAGSRVISVDGIELYGKSFRRLQQAVLHR